MNLCLDLIFVGFAEDYFQQDALTDVHVCSERAGIYLNLNAFKEREGGREKEEQTEKQILGLEIDESRSRPAAAACHRDFLFAASVCAVVPEETRPAKCRNNG